MRLLYSNSSFDVLNDVIAKDGLLYAVGTTKDGSTGFIDGVVLNIDQLTGNLLDTTLWGGGADSLFNGVTIADSKLFAIGSTQAFGATGSDVAIVSFALPTQENNVPEPGTIALLLTGLFWVWPLRQRVGRKN